MELVREVVVDDSMIKLFDLPENLRQQSFKIVWTPSTAIEKKQVEPNHALNLCFMPGSEVLDSFFEPLPEEILDSFDKPMFDENGDFIQHGLV